MSTELATPAPTLPTPFVAALLLMATLTRFVGLGWGLPRQFNVDEVRMTALALEAVEGVATPVHSDYGPVPIVLTAWAFRACAAIVPACGEDGRLAREAKLAYAARVGEALVGVATVAVVMRLGLALGGVAVALTAGLLFAFAPLAEQLSKVFGVDAYLAFFGAAALLLGVRVVERRRLVDALAMGAMVGAGAATKLTGLALLAPIVLAHALPPRPARGRAWRGLGAGLAAAVATFLAFSPAAITSARRYWLLDLADPSWWHFLAPRAGVTLFPWNVLMVSGVIQPLWAFASADPVPLRAAIVAALWSIGPVALVAPVGGWLAWRQRRPVARFLVLATLVQLLAVGTTYVHYTR
jgi:4-amino-4-deoxy-L-arabinose transferase-like glycosyltransferase